MRRLVAGVGICVLLLTGCGTAEKAKPHTAGLNLSPHQNRLTAERVQSAAELVPQRIRRRGILRIGGTIDNTPPLSCYATDNKTPIGFEPDIATLVAGVLGLKPKRDITSWENMFLGVDSGRYDVAFSNISVTPERMKKYDFATYRQDLLAFEARKGTGIKVDGPADLSGKKVALASGSTQEKVMLQWNAVNREASRPPIDIQYYQKASDYYLALQSGRVDVYVGPSSSTAYHVRATGETELVGEVKTENSYVGAMTGRGNGLAKAVAAAVNTLIDDGKYQKVLKRWGLSGQKIGHSEANPPTPEAR